MMNLFLRALGGFLALVIAVAVAKFAAGTGSHDYISFSSSAAFGLQSGSFGFYSTSNVVGGAGDTNAHAFQSVANSTSSTVTTDASTSSTQSSGGQAAGINPALYVDDFGNYFNGALCEVGMIVSALSGTDISNMHANQSAFYGTP